MNCKICNNKSDLIFKEKVLHKYDISFFRCENCEFIQTEEPYWINEAYTNSINISDTGYLHRNILFSKKITILICLFFNVKGNFLDFASGYGVFPRLMRDIGFDFYWDDKYTENIFSKGFEFDNKYSIEAITVFECFEHFINPIEELEKMLKISNNIIFSTELIPVLSSIDKNWDYFGFNHGQHISFYSRKTLEYLSEKYGLNYYNLKGLHIFSKNKLSKIKLNLTKLTRFGLHNMFKKRLKSKMWDDHINLNSIK